MKPLSCIAFLLLAFFLSCADQPKDSSQNNPPADPPVMSTAPADTMPAPAITGIKWMVSEVNGKSLSAYPSQNKPPYLLLTSEGRAEGTGGCNGMSGGYSMGDGNKISFQQMISTKMACPDMTLESDFSSALMNATMYAMENGMLVLRNDANTALIKFTPAAE